MAYALAEIRTFRTKHFTVIVDAIPEDDLDLSWDEDGSARAGIESGKFVFFCARARVVHDNLGEIASDYLGGCIHEDFADFMDHKECAKYQRESRAAGSGVIVGSYFSDMIMNVCCEARDALEKAKGIYVRAAA